MKKHSHKLTDDMRPEYDFASMRGGVRGKYVNRYRQGTNLVLLDPEVAEAFPTDAAVNETLRAALNITGVVGRKAAPPNKALQPTSPARRRKKQAPRRARALATPR